MNTSGFLDQLLGSARSLISDASQRARTASDRLQDEGIAGVKLGKFAQGAVAAGALSLLLGNRRGRRLATVGGLAAIGTLAYRALRAQHTGTAAAIVEPQTVDRLPASQVEQHSHGILVALVAAAKADGHIDARERQLIHDEVARLAGDGELEVWLDEELVRPVDAAAVASKAATPELAAEMYLASVLVIDEPNPAEQAYLDALAHELRLDSALRANLDRQLALAADGDSAGSR